MCGVMGNIMVMVICISVCIYAHTEIYMYIHTQISVCVCSIFSVGLKKYTFFFGSLKLSLVSPVQNLFKILKVLLVKWS